jgi:hypothetical protein
MSGVNYWEIVADARTEHEIKAGVTKTTEFNINTAFCDYAFGWGYYGMGSLRHTDNSQGINYGKAFKKQGILGICLNMEKGTLAFAIDGEYFGVAFEDEDLKKGPIYPAVAMLHLAGCYLVSGKPVPAIFSS